MGRRKSYRSSSAKGRAALTQLLRKVITMEARMRSRNPPKALDVPPEYVTDPYKPIPKSYSKAKRQRISELREAYEWAMNRRFSRKTLSDPDLAAELLKPLMAPLEVEVLMLLPLDSRSRLISEPIVISKGDIDGTDAGPRAITRAALQSGAATMLIAHNHPTGTVVPSAGDLAVTKRIIKAGRVVDVQLVDHLIIGATGQHTSIRRTNSELWMGSNPRRLSKVKTGKKKRRNPSNEGMLLGDLVEMTIRYPNGSERLMKIKSRFIGWVPATKALCILKRTRSNPVNALSQSVVDLHKKFHNAAPTHATNYEWPDPQGAKKNVGRIVSLTYKIPKGMKSPQKNKFIWHHEFGDHGERGHGPVGNSGKYPEKLMPTLQKDAAGNLYIKRNPGNKYYVKDWLYW